MRGILQVLGVKDRRVWVADSFEGLPPVDPALHPKEAKAVSGPTIKNGYKNFAASIEEVKRNFQAFDLLDEQTSFLKGWFKDTLPSVPVERLPLCDWTETSTNRRGTLSPLSTQDLLWAAT